MKVEVSKDWCLKMAKQEDGAEISAGVVAIDEPFYCIFSGKEINEVLADIGREVAAELKDSSV
jgi:hypothetical protein